MGSRTTFLAENFQRLATDVGYADASGLGCGWVWINPNEDSFYYVLRLPWPEDIMLDLASTDNPHGRITNYVLELAALVLQELTFTSVYDNPEWQGPFTGSDNIPTVA